jgi:multimeric flavodoxin WrbA
MKAIAINGSPRKGGNTEILLREVLKPLTDAGWDTEFIQLGGKPIRWCCFSESLTRRLPQIPLDPPRYFKQTVLCRKHNSVAWTRH